MVCVSRIPFDPISRPSLPRHECKYVLGPAFQTVGLDDKHDNCPQQARALGEFFADTHLTAIHASDLKRAFTTAQVLYDGQREPKPTFDSSQLLREQHFGVAEGKPWSYVTDRSFNLEEEMAKGVYPVPHGNDEKFTDGESINDLAQRAKEAITTIVLPHVWQAAKEGKADIHVAVVGHGLCISHMVSQLLKMGAKQDEELDYRGLWNTAWTRVVVESEVRVLTQR